MYKVNTVPPHQTEQDFEAMHSAEGFMQAVLPEGSMGILTDWERTGNNMEKHMSSASLHSGVGIKMPLTVSNEIMKQAVKERKSDHITEWVKGYFIELAQGDLSEEAMNEQKPEW